MPQIFQVLRCYKCSVFQVHQAKKSNKFECKMCGEKQSIKRHYGIGNAKECRGHVQRLNIIRGEVAETGVSSQCDTGSEDDIGKDENVANSSGTNKTSSKWSNYIESPDDSPEENNTEFLNNQEVVLEVPRKRPRKNYYGKKSTKYSKNRINSDDDTKSFLDSNENNDEIQVNKENVSASKRKTIFVQPVLKSNFKPDYNMDDTTLNKDNDTNYSCRRQAIKENTNLVHRSQKLEIMSSSSKWAQYVDEDVNKEQDNEKFKEDEYVNDEKAENNIDNQRKSDGAAIQQLFSQCDDEDWDNVLSF